MVRARAVLFVVGIITVLASLIGLAFSFNYEPAFLAALPRDLRIYFGLTLLCGLVALGSSFARALY